MTFGSFDEGADNAPLAEINMVPLIDVMLVLLVIFLVTSPLLTHAVKVELPKASSSVQLVKPQTIQLTIDIHGRVFWNSQMVDALALTMHLRQAGASLIIPELHISAQGSTPFEKVAQIMSEASRTGLTKIGFVTDPLAQ